MDIKIIFGLDPVKYPITGIGRYTYELAKALPIGKRIDSLIFIRGNKLCKLIPKASQTAGKFNKIIKIMQQNRIAAETYRMCMPRLKAWNMRKLNDYLYHGPNFYLPPFNGKKVVTIHDLSVYNWSECHPRWRVQFMQSEMKLTLKRAHIIITDSEFVRKEIGIQFKFPTEKIFSIPLASSKEYHQYNDAETISILDEYGLDLNGYCLFSGTIEPRKNIITLLEAYQNLPLALRKKWPLILTGYEGWNSKDIHKRIKIAQKEGWAQYLGYVPSEHLPKLFAGARLFVFPSLYEGFGLPVLEAMASGVPVVCSNSSSLPEVVGDAGAMCDPLDTDALAGLIMNGLENEEWRKESIKKGLKRAKLFSWERCANETIEAYKAALQS